LPEQRSGVGLIGNGVALAVQQRAELRFQFAVAGGFVGKINGRRAKHAGQRATTVHGFKEQTWAGV